MSHTTGNQIVVEEEFHSEVGASSSTRWRTCKGSRNLIAKLAKEGKINKSSSRAAAEGTAAHLVLQTCLEDGSDSSDMAGFEITVGEWTFVVDDEMVNGVQECLDWVRNRISRAKAEGFEVQLYIEKGLTSITDDDVYGKPDIIIHIVNDRLIVVDFKYGRGISVEPDSDQNYYYSYLSVENYLETPDSVKVVECWIAQPRIPHPNGTIRRHITNATELTAWWFDGVLPDIQATRDPNAPLEIGEHCRFCPAKSACPALKSEVFEFSTTIDPDHMSDDELGLALTKLKALKTVTEVYEREALRRAKLGVKISGWKMVRKKGNRVWKEQQPIREGDGEMVPTTLEEAMDRAFGLECWTEPERKSPAQVEKMDGGNDFASLWAYSPNLGLTLAAESDKRMEVRPNVERFYNQAG